MLDFKHKIADYIIGTPYSITKEKELYYEN